MLFGYTSFMFLPILNLLCNFITKDYGLFSLNILVTDCLTSKILFNYSNVEKNTAKLDDAIETYNS